ncbi:ABC-type transport auxiliary lipoprotein family protein [Methylocapsa polymorpha]|uniref:ABC-type transport auxiliary lipoprotein family protein n=1 Tax=Methylocapsa polymorpha TaxID=3080828 RepID=A0ABZ0HTX7_9HYPH|nr:ABC-type transport auxiliary lipoprotein family protein [Methylocapsa sp. RX1]
METRARYVLVGLFVLVASLAGFGFVYWLHATGGLGERAAYRVRFENTVSGLRTGAAVSFNGIRVGEVTNLQLNAENPHQVFVTIAIDPWTPIRADTQARIDVQGLMGSPSVNLSGGSPNLPVLKASQGEPPPVLIADAAAGQDLTQSARAVLGRIDKILAENSDSLHDAIANFDTFSGALARNSKGIDGIVAGLEKTFGGGASKGPLPTYDLTAPHVAVAPSKKPGKELVVADPTTLVRNDTQRIIVVASDGQSSFLDNAQWADSAPKVIQAKIIQSLENANFLAGVGRPSDNLTTDYQLLVDLHSFQISLGSPPKATIEFMAKIVGQNGRIIDARLFSGEAPVAAMDPVAATEALNQAFMQAATQLVQWTAQKI